MYDLGFCDLAFDSPYGLPLGLELIGPWKNEHELRRAWTSATVRGSRRPQCCHIWPACRRGIAAGTPPAPTADRRSHAGGGDQGQMRVTERIRIEPSTFGSFVSSPMAIVPFETKPLRVSLAAPSTLTVATWSASRLRGRARARGSRWKGARDLAGRRRGPRDPGCDRLPRAPSRCIPRSRPRGR